jgi:hypothetical protein
MARKKTAKTVRGEFVDGGSRDGTEMVPTIPSSMTLVHRDGHDDRHQLEADAMSVFLARGEAFMKKKVADLTAAHKEATQEVGKADMATATLLREINDEIAAEIRDAFLDSELRTVLGIPNTGFTCSARAAAPRRENKAARWGKMRVEITILRLPSKDRLLETVIYRQSSKALIAACKQHEELVAKSQELYQQALAWQRKQTRVDEMERAGRALVAQRRLESTEDGQTQLNDMLGRVEEICDKLG